MIAKDLNESYTVIEGEINDLLKIANKLQVYQPGYQFTPAYRSGVWDGKKHFYTFTPNGMIIPKGLAESVTKHFNIPYECSFTPQKITKDELLKFIETLNLPFQPRDYQIKAILTAINNPRKIIVSATGSGKSFIIYVVIRYFLHKNMRGVLVVPNISLVEQMYSDFKDYNWKNIDEYVHIIYQGKEKHFKKPLTITTWQIVYQNLHLFKEPDFILIDECHLAKAESLEKILNASQNAKYKIGFTGTLPENPVDRFTLTSTLGKSETIITPKELIDLGYATPVEVVMFFINYNDEDKKYVRNIKNYQKEIKFIEEHFKRNVFITKLALKVTNNKNTLILYNKIKHGNFLMQLLLSEKLGVEYDKIILSKEYFKIDGKKYKYEDYNIYYIRGEVEGVERERIRNILENKSNAILIATYQTLSTGVNIKNLHNIFLTTPTKSFIRLNQTIGRGMRKHDTKDKVLMFDFVDDFSTVTKNGKVRYKNYCLKHADERIRMYLQNGYNILEKEIKI